jgi:hypothetical protein
MIYGNHVVQKKGHQDGIGVVLTIDSVRAIAEGTARIVADAFGRTRGALHYDSIWLCSVSTSDAWNVG